MADFYAGFSGSGSYQLHLVVNQASQNQGGNYSTDNWALYVEKTAGSGFWTSSSGNTGGISGDISGSANGWAPYDFTGYTQKLIGSGSGNVAHNADGTKTASGGFSANDSAGDNFGSSSGSWSLAQTRIPKAPLGTTTLSSLTVKSATELELAFSFAGDNGGSAITGYRIQYALDAGFTTGVGTKDVGTSSPVTLNGLTPGTLYYVRIAAKNAIGVGAYSSAKNARTLGGFRINDGGTWKTMLLYEKIAGEWKLLVPHVNDGGTWKVLG